jgi:hypothetical protein
VNVERGTETDKDASPQRSDDLLWRAGRGEKDGLHAGPDVAHLLDQRQAFVNGGVRVSDDNVEGLLAQTANRARATTSAFTVAIDGGERLRDRTDGVRLFADKKNAAHTVVLSSIIDDNSRACLFKQWGIREKHLPIRSWTWVSRAADKITVHLLTRSALEMGPRCQPVACARVTDKT